MPIDDSLSWPLVYAFFHPESRMDGVRSPEQGLDALLGGLLSNSIGISSSSEKWTDASEGDSTLQQYDGVPVCLVYEAYDVSRRDQYWRAQIEILSGMSIGENVLVSVTDANGEAIEKARLVLLGSELVVSHGLAAYNLAEFQQNLSNTEVRLVYSSGVSVSGTLKLGEDLFV